MKNLSLCFYFPYHEVSGVPVLFARMTNVLVYHPDIKEIFIIDYSDGAITRSAKAHSKITLIPFEDGKKVVPPSHSTLIMQAIIPYCMRPELSIAPETKIIFWSLHPDNLVPVLLPFPYLRNLQNRFFGFYKSLQAFLFKSLIKKVREFVKLCIYKNALYFMDRPNMDKASRYLFMQMPDDGFVPVPVTPAPLRKPVITNIKEFKFCWVGRLCDFKVYILQYTIEQLSKLSQQIQLPIKYYVVGSGPFEQMISSLHVNHEFFQFEMKGSMQQNGLDQFLFDEIDVVTAMGTSALEAAKLGIPAILLDMSYQVIKGDYCFRWLHNTIDFDLAHNITESDMQNGNTSLADMLHSLREDYVGLSEKSFNYFTSHHHIDSVCNIFLKKLADNSLKFSDINSSILKRSLFRKIYDKARKFI